MSDTPNPAGVGALITDEMVKAAEIAAYGLHERGFIMRPLIDPIDMRAAISAALAASLPLSGAAEGEPEWRDLALQFDGHRIEALALLRYVAEATNSAEAMGRIGEIKPFLAKPPLSGEAVLAQRIAASPQSPDRGEGEAEPFLTARGWENLSCDDQFTLAKRIASNVGYVLVPEPEIDPIIPEGQSSDIAWQIANECWLSTNDKARLARRIRSALKDTTP